jgi:exopolysaccharide biosynthesis polyprenyl glycosylphosphotransferase
MVQIPDLEAMLTVVGPDLAVVLPGPGISGAEFRRLAWRLDSARVRWVVCTGITDTVQHRLSVRSIGHAPMFEVAQARLSGPSRIVKALFDRIVAAFGLLLVIPVLVLVGLAVWCEDGGSPFFVQTRVGRGGSQFPMVKFRTMVVGAEALRGELSHLNESDGALFKIARDPRLTSIGRFLRRFSIDELPQLINVLRGEMSLVGPRPPLPTEVAEYSADMRRRLLVKPGMTGLWQVSGRTNLTWAQSERLDLRYVENWSLGFDLRILARTVRAVVTGTGAY